LPETNIQADTVESANPRRAVTGQARARDEGFRQSDPILQVAEVRDYFTKQWQPAEDISQTLEYNLVIASDGSLSQIIPLGNAAQTHIDRVKMPFTGKPFVSPLSGDRKAQIRLVLTPQGEVKTFLMPQ